MENENQPVSIDLTPEVAKGQYSNLAIITHSNSEFVIDFAAMLPGLPKPQVESRIIMTPDHAKSLMAALIDNIKKYEQTFGPIQANMPQEKGTFNLGDLADFGGNGTKS